MALRTVGIRLQAQISGYMADLRQAKTATKDFASELDKAAREGKLDAVADQATKVGLVLVGLAAGAVTMAARFDKAMSSVQAATHASGTELEMLRDAALKAGKDTAFSATEAAQGIEELAKAGVETADILGGGLAGALDLAAAGEMAVADAAETAASTMVQFKLAGKDVGHVADLLAAGAGKAQGSVHDLSMALNQGGLVAAQMGLSVEDTVGTLAAFASAGLMGSDAGTSLKTALLMLANPTDKAASLMNELGIQVYDSSGQFVGITALAGQLRSQLGHLTQEQRNAALATIFGSDAIRSASILYERGADGIQEWINKVNDQGFAAETARLKTDNLIGDIERLTGELETLAITSGGGVNSGLRTLTQTTESLVAQIGSLPPWITSTGVVLAGLTGVALLGAAGWIKMRRSAADALAELRATGPAGARAATGLQTVSRWAGRVGAAFAASQVAAVALRAAIGDQLNPQIDALSLGLERWATSGDVAGEATRVLGKDLEFLEYDLRAVAQSGWWADTERGIAGMIEGFTGLGSVADLSLEKARSRMGALDSALAQMVQSGNAAAAADIFTRIAKEADRQGISIEELKKAMPQYAAALEMGAKGAEGAANALAGVGNEAEDAKKAIDELKEAFDRLFGVEMDLDRAQIAVKEGMVEVRAELEKGKRTLDINSKAGRDNATAVLDQVDKLKELRQARIDHGTSIDEANELYKKDIQGLRNTMLQLGFNEAAVDDLIKKYYDIPEKVDTEVSVETQKAVAAAKYLKQKIDELKDKKIYIEGTVKWTSKGLKVPGGTILEGNRWGGLYEHAQVGTLRDAQIASPMGPARYAWAEPATGGELFAPKFGDLNRTRALVGYAIENWWGGWRNFAPQMAQPAPTSPQGMIVENLNIRAYSDRFSMAQVRAELAMHGVS